MPDLSQQYLRLPWVLRCAHATQASTQPTNLPSSLFLCASVPLWFIHSSFVPLWFIPSSSVPLCLCGSFFLPLCLCAFVVHSFFLPRKTQGRCWVLRCAQAALTCLNPTYESSLIDIIENCPQTSLQGRDYHSSSSNH